LGDFIGIIHDVRRGHADYLTTKPFHIQIPSPIMSLLCFIPMPRAINLNDQPGGRAIEIRDVGSDGMLSTKRRFSWSPLAQS
jgi:hypothetical protein